MRELRVVLAQDFAIDADEITRIPHGTDPQASLWHVRSGAGGFAVKVSEDEQVGGLRCTEVLGKANTPGILRPAHTRSGLPWLVRDGLRISVARWVDGHRALDAGLTHRQWREFGAILAAVHAHDPAEFDGVPHESYDHVTVLDLIATVDSALAHVEPVAARVWFDAAPRVDAVRRRADDLARSVGAAPNADVVCHGDAHLGNVLVDHDGGLWLVDWDSAVVAPPERDLLFVVGGVLADSPVGAAARAAFFDGYGSNAVDLDRLAYFRCIRALEDVAGWAAAAFDRAATPGERASALQILQGICSPTGLLDLALT